MSDDRFEDRTDPRTEVDANGRPMPIARRVYGGGFREIPECSTCAKRGFRTAVELMTDGEPTGLCLYHGAKERDLRRALNEASKVARLTPERVKEIRQRIYGTAT